MSQSSKITLKHWKGFERLKQNVRVAVQGLLFPRLAFLPLRHLWWRNSDISKRLFKQKSIAIEKKINQNNWKGILKLNSLYATSVVHSSAIFPSQELKGFSLHACPGRCGVSYLQWFHVCLIYFAFFNVELPLLRKTQPYPITFK